MAAPPLTQSDAVTSLLSLSIAAASSVPILPLGASPASSSPRQHPSQLSSTSKHHRRLGSTGKTRRRLSDAREACTRPLLASNTAALSLASLSLSASPPSTIQTTTTSFGGICKPLAPKPHSNSVHIISGSAPNPVHVSSGDGTNFSLLASAATAAPPAAAGLPVGNAEHSDTTNTTSTTPIPISNGKTGAKKRGIDYKCESCSKVYRHPNCLNKHRWEHTRQWREASKFVLSKHQQVQLLEAAAILSFMGKQPASLPEDRSEWPSFLSGGSLPKIEPVGGSASSVPSASTSASSIPSPSSLGLPSSGISSATSTSGLAHFHTSSTPTHSVHPISSSVPNPQPSGPRLHDYALKAPGGKVVVTQVRPGLLLGVNSNGDPSMPYATGTASAAYPKSMPVHQFTPARTPHHTYGYDYGHAPVVAPVPTLGARRPSLLNGNGNWSLPNSSMRSVSHGRSLSSLSGSVSAQSEDGDIEIDIEDGDEDEDDGKGGYGRRRVLVKNGMGIDVEGDADGMDDDDDDEHYDGHNHEGDEHHDDNDNNEEDEGIQTQNETYHHTRYNARFNASIANQTKPRWDGVGMDIEMDMDMDMD